MSPALACATALLISSEALAVPLAQPLRFFEGRTESVGTMKIVMHKTRRVRSLGRGTIGQDGSLTLIQDVHDDGDAPHQRTWHIRQVGPESTILANIYGGVSVAAAAGYLIGGPVLDATSPRTAFALVGVGGLAAAALTAALVRAAR